MQSQIAFVPRRPQLVSVAEFDDEPICLFVRIETARRQTAKCPCRVIARDFDDRSVMRLPQILRWNTISSLSRSGRGTQIKSALPLELERSRSSAKRTTSLPRVGTTQRRTVKSSRQFDGVFVSENANRLLELLDLKRLL